MKTTLASISAGLLLLSAGSMAAVPADSSSADCVREAEHQLHVAHGEIDIVSGANYSLAGQRRLVMLQTELSLDGAEMRPRFYCIVEPNGKIHRLESNPRLPFAAAPTLSAR